MKNTATGTNALTLLGTATNQSGSINIGYGSSVTNTNSVVLGASAQSAYAQTVAIGYQSNANDTSSTAVGYKAYTNYQQASAYGYDAQATAAGTLAVGSNSRAVIAQANAFGFSAKANNYGSTALGYNAVASANYAIQIGNGTNSTASTLAIGFNGTNYQLLDGTTGLIPDARISSNIARTSAIPDISTKQDTLVSGTNIKTINNTSVLGSGNIDTSEIFVANGTTTYNEISNALRNGKTVFYNSGNIYYQYTYSTATKHQFTSLITLYSNDIRVEYATVNTSNTWNITTYTVANTDLSNLSATGKTVIDGQWVIVETAIATDLKLNNSSGTNYLINVSSYLPNDGYTYEVLIDALITSTATSGQYCNLIMAGSGGWGIYIATCRPRSNASVQSSGNGILLVDSSRIITVARQSNYYGTANINLKGYRRIGTNT